MRHGQANSVERMETGILWRNLSLDCEWKGHLKRKQEIRFSAFCEGHNGA